MSEWLKKVALHPLHQVAPCVWVHSLWQSKRCKLQGTGTGRLQRINPKTLPQLESAGTVTCRLSSPEPALETAAARCNNIP